MGQFPTVTEGGGSQNGICPQVLLVFGPGEWPSGGAGAGPRERRAGNGKMQPNVQQTRRQGQQGDPRPEPSWGGAAVSELRGGWSYVC